MKESTQYYNFVHAALQYSLCLIKSRAKTWPGQIRAIGGYDELPAVVDLYIDHLHDHANDINDCRDHLVENGLPKGLATKCACNEVRGLSPDQWIEDTLENISYDQYYYGQKKHNHFGDRVTDRVPTDYSIKYSSYGGWPRTDQYADYFAVQYRGYVYFGAAGKLHRIKIHLDRAFKFQGRWYRRPTKRKRIGQQTRAILRALRNHARGLTVSYDAGDYRLDHPVYGHYHISGNLLGCFKYHYVHAVRSAIHAFRVRRDEQIQADAIAMHLDDIIVTRDDSIRAGNCTPETDRVADHFGLPSVSAGVLLQYRNDSYSLRAVAAAARRLGYC